MNNSCNPATTEILNRLTRIYQRISCARRVDKNSQMCQFWSDPTVEILIGSDELVTIETEFGIEFDSDSAMELYNMDLGEAADYIGKMIRKQNAESFNSEKFINSIDPEKAKKVLLQLWREHYEVRPAIIQEIEAETYRERGIII